MIIFKLFFCMVSGSILVRLEASILRKDSPLINNSPNEIETLRRHNSDFTDDREEELVSDVYAFDKESEYVNSDLTSLNDLACSTNLNSVFPGNWSCNPLYPSSRAVACSWVGVHCDKNGSVLSLRLGKKSIIGSIPKSIGGLVMLRILDLSSNSFVSTIPSTLGYLTYLQYLSLASNKLSSRLPTSLGNLVRLTSLSLNHNSLSSTLPTSLGLLCSLRLLMLSNNHFSGVIPSVLGYLTSLKAINLYLNKLSGTIPTVLGSLPYLTGLWLNHNNLVSSIPDTIGRLTSLQFVSLSFNSLTGVIPTSIGYLSLCNYLFLSSNQLHGVIPSALGNLKFLLYLTLSGNKLTGSIPTSFGNLQSLQVFYLYKNMISSSLPTTISLLTSIQILLLANNKLSGTIPTAIGLLHSLVQLWLSGNQLSGAIPSLIGNLTTLKFLALSNNKISGMIPTSIGRLQALTSMSMNRNRLSSSIPTTIGLLKSLLQLQLSGNKISGIIPTTIANIPSLQILALQSNQLSAGIPSDLGFLKHLVQLDLSDNLLSSSIPSTLSLLAKLTSLNIGDNKLTSTVPIELVGLHRLYLLSLEGNKLSGDFPIDLCLPNLAYVTLLGNKFSCIPWCQDDFDWSSAVISTPRCRDYQDQVLLDLQSSLGLTSALQSQASLRSSSRVMESPHPFIYESSYMKSVNDTYAYEYIVDISVFQLWGYLLFCSDSTCTHIIGKYGSNGWLAPTGIKSLIIRASSFFVQSLFDITTCPALDGYHLCGLAFGFKLTLFSRLQEPIGWSFGTALPYTPVATTSQPLAYATNLCQSVWYGVTCSKGQVSGIYLNGLGLQGTLPTTIGSLTSLTSLDVSGNRISGTIISAIGLLTNLNSLNLNQNSLEGTFPKSLSNATKLYFISVSGNKLTGSLPSLLDALPDIQYAYLDGNVFSGEITSQLCNDIHKNNAILSITHNELLTCYQDGCVSALGSNLKLDATLNMCEPTSVPTTLPSSVPTVKPTLQPVSDRLIVQSILTQSAVIAVSTCLSVTVFLLVIFIIFRTVFSQKAIKSKANKARLAVLPIHRNLLDMNLISVEKLLATVDENIATANEKDLEGRTALDIVLEEKKKVPYPVIYRLLEQCLPFDVTSGALFEADRFAGWAKAVQSENDEVILAVEKLLIDHKKFIRLFANAKDKAGRKCIELANFRVKELLHRHMYLFGRYDIEGGPPVHKSATSLVLFASDTFYSPDESIDETGSSNSTPWRVALKFMKNLDQFEREVDIRSCGNFSPKFVISLLSAYSNASDVDKAFREDAILKGYGEYPYCIVMEAGSKNLKNIIDDEYIAGMDWMTIKDMTSCLAHSLDHLHSRGIIHGDLKPLNILRVNSVLKLTDLDASVVYITGAFAGCKFSSGYVPPEMLVMVDSEVIVQSSSNLPIARLSEVTCIEANPSQDMWALGCVLYFLFTGASLFHVNTDDNIVSQQEYMRLFEWDTDVKESKLSIVKDPLARNLLSLLLMRDPMKRPTAARVLQHPFLSGKRGVRLQGEDATWDVFLSYRVSSDSHLAEVIYKELISRGLKVWWDKFCLEPGQNWEEGFCKGLVSSSYFICLVSRASIKHPTRSYQNWEQLTEFSRCDSVLLEWRLALDLKERGMLEGIYPVMIGDLDASGHYSDFSSSGCHPAAPELVVTAVESKVREHLEREGLGSPYTESMSVKAIVDAVFLNQGSRIRGDLKKCIDQFITAILEMTKLRRRSCITVSSSQLKFIVDELKREVSNLSDQNRELKSNAMKIEAEKVELEERVSKLLRGIAST